LEGEFEKRPACWESGLGEELADTGRERGNEHGQRGGGTGKRYRGKRQIFLTYEGKIDEERGEPSRKIEFAGRGNRHQSNPRNQAGAVNPQWLGEKVVPAGNKRSERKRMLIDA